MLEEDRTSCLVCARAENEEGHGGPEDLCPGPQARPLQFVDLFLPSVHCASQPAHRANHATIAPNHPIKAGSRQV